MKKLKALCALTACALIVSLAAPAAAFADSASSKPDGLIAIDEAVTVAVGETYYNNGEVVFNNGGTVFNNGGTVFNNSGVVFNNDGTVYNNGGTVYNNAGTVHNNSGYVEDNSVAAAAVTGGEIISESKTDKTDKAGKEEPAKDEKSEFTVTFAGDYPRFIDTSKIGDVGALTVTADDRITLAPEAGVTITDAVTTAGACTIDNSGKITLQKVDRDGKLTLKFKLDAPVIAPGEGSYADDALITLTAPYSHAKIYYTLDGSTPTTESTLYTKPFEIDSSCILKAVATAEGAASSETAEASYIFPSIAELDFGMEEQGYKAVEAQALAVKNTGLGKLKIMSVKLEGEDKDSFTLSTEKGGTVATGQSDTKTWTVAPKRGLAVGEYEAEAVFILDSGESIDVDIHFSVTAKGTAKNAVKGTAKA